jgi:hypothetical protein
MSRPTLDLDGISEAEWEYAHRYIDYLELGEAKPKSAGFDPVRIAEIERRLDDHYRGILRGIRDYPRK